MSKIKDLKGQRFGKLTVIDRYENTKSGRVRWLCKCDCGNTVVRASDSLKWGDTFSCGCNKKYNEELTGKTYNRLTVVEFAERRKGKIYLKCKCSCGNETIVEKYSLVHGNTKSCGCLISESSHNTHFEDLSGMRYGKLLVLSREKSKNKKTMWKCICECGNTSVVGAIDLKRGSTKSCGCLKFESRNSTHGLSKTRLHSIWSGMKERCYRKNSPAYKWYGERGITIYQEWIDDFMNFYNWAMDNGYEDGLSIDRINVNENYEPSNCRWIPLEEQALNTRTTKFLTYKGETKTVSEWCEITGIKKTTMLNRMRLGFTAEECIEMPIHAKREYYKNK